MSQDRMNDDKKEYIPKDLGREVFDFIQNEFYRSAQIKSHESDVLYNFWLGLRKRQVGLI